MRLIGKNKDLLFIKEEKENKETYIRYYFFVKCKNCNNEFKITSGHCNRATCPKCKKNEFSNSLINTKIGIYIIKNYSHKIKSTKFFNCECTLCGLESVLKHNSIKKNKNCIHCFQRGIKPKIESQLKHIFNQYINNAKERNLNFDINKEQFKKLISSNCYYCGIAPKEKIFTQVKNLKIGLLFNGIDRVNNIVGYTIDNCVTCCSVCNQMKMAFTKENFINKIKEIYKNLNL